MRGHPSGDSSGVPETTAKFDVLKLLADKN